ncbi:MAG: HlyD family efflux transporter periplasmic adaptor subunit, partial [Planctomycetota bacterium]
GGLTLLVFVLALTPGGAGHLVPVAALGFGLGLQLVPSALGVLYFRHITETGAFASPGQPVLTLSSAQGLEARFELPERHVGAITQGQTLTLTFPQRPGAAPVPATVVTAGQAALGAGRLFPIVAHLPARPDVLPGMTVAAALPMPARDVFTALPDDAEGTPSRGWAYKTVKT